MIAPKNSLAHIVSLMTNLITLCQIIIAVNLHVHNNVILISDDGFVNIGTLCAGLKNISYEEKVNLLLERKVPGICQLQCHADCSHIWNESIH